MLPALGATTVHVELTEVRVGQNLAIGAQGLLQDLAPVRDEEQSRKCRSVGGQATVVERSDDGLAGTRRRHQEIPMTAMDDALDLELVEHLLLVRVRTHLEARESQGHPVVESLPGCFGQRVVQLVAV